MTFFLVAICARSGISTAMRDGTETRSTFYPQNFQNSIFVLTVILVDFLNASVALFRDSQHLGVGFVMGLFQLALRQL